MSTYLESGSQLCPYDHTMLLVSRISDGHLVRTLPGVYIRLRAG